MASTGTDLLPQDGPLLREKSNQSYDRNIGEKLPPLGPDGLHDPDTAMPYPGGEPNMFKPHFDSTHRKLKSRHIQLIGIGGCVHASNASR